MTETVELTRGGVDDMEDDVLGALHREQYAPLVRFATLLLHNRNDAEEVVQEAFLRAGDAWARSRPPDVPAAYVRVAVANLARSRLRRRAVTLHLRPVARAATGESAEEAALRSDLENAVFAGLARLSSRQRLCVCLRYYLDLSDAEVAATVGISLGSAKTHLRRGLAALGPHLMEQR